MVRRLALLSAILVFVAWGPKSHDVVGTIAQKLLNDDDERAVQESWNARRMADREAIYETTEQSGLIRSTFDQNPPLDGFCDQGSIRT
jgi:hypothetical protein